VTLEACAIEGDLELDLRVQNNQVCNDYKERYKTSSLPPSIFRNRPSAHNSISLKDTRNNPATRVSKSCVFVHNGEMEKRNELNEEKCKEKKLKGEI
jgi:hypothetical protein